ncbi:MAG: sensor histidine kinase, partial [Curvibacter sp.]|nr:sensor histidine kinase [Curvibacter sp.]
MSYWIYRRGLMALGLAGTALALVAGIYSLTERYQLSVVERSTAHHLEIYSASLRNELRLNENLPPVVALNQDVRSLLRHPSDPALQAAVNGYLKTVSLETGVAAVYVIDAQGLTLASSNWDQPISFVHQNYAYRPYFQDAVRGGVGRFYGIGTSSREPGYYYAHGVREGDRISGVITVKVNLEALDLTWRQPGEKVFVLDEHGVVILSSEPAWKFRTLDALAPEVLAGLKASRQYAGVSELAPIGFDERKALGGDSALWSRSRQTTAGAGADPGARVSYLAVRQSVAGSRWHLYVLTDLFYPHLFAVVGAAGVVLVLVLVLVLLLYFLQKRRFLQDTLGVKIALLRANDELEQKVALRTRDLTDSNHRLQAEVQERQRAEEAQKATFNELVHAAKMAALGQISAGITHELNQPLAALCTLSANTRVFFERGDGEIVLSNLEMIAHLGEHMGKITSQLKRFARKSLSECYPVSLALAIHNAVFLLQQVVREQHIELVQHTEPPSLQAWCDMNRLEQVLINLLSNAVDSVCHLEGARRIEVRAFQEDDMVVIEVHDNGGGISESVA